MIGAAGLLVTTIGLSAFDWPVASPETNGLDRGRLEALGNDLSRRRTRALLVFRDDHIVFERYATNHTRTARQGTASLAKALAGGMSLMFAMNDGRMRPDDLLARFIPSWTNDPLKRQIRVRHLATHLIPRLVSTTHSSAGS